MKAIINFLKSLLGFDERPAPTRVLHAVKTPVNTPVQSEHPRDVVLRQAHHAIQQFNQRGRNQTPSGAWAGSVTLEQMDDYLTHYSGTEFREMAKQYLDVNPEVRVEMVFDVTNGNLRSKEHFIALSTGGMPIPYAYFEEVRAEREAKTSVPTVPAVGGVVHDGKVVEVPVTPTAPVEEEDESENDRAEALMKRYLAEPEGLVKFLIERHYDDESIPNQTVLMVARAHHHAIEAVFFPTEFVERVKWASNNPKESAPDHVYVGDDVDFYFYMGDDWFLLPLAGAFMDNRTGEHPEPVAEEPPPTLVIEETVAFTEPMEEDEELRAEADRYTSDGRYHLVKTTNAEGVLVVRPATSTQLPWIPATYFAQALVDGLTTLDEYEANARARKMNKARRLGARERKRLEQQ